MSDNQPSLFDWKPPAEIVPFPLHRSHGMTVIPARRFVTLKRDKQTGLLLSLRSKMMKRYTALFGEERAAIITGELVEAILLRAEYERDCPSQKQNQPQAVILALPSRDDPGALRAGKAGAQSVPRAVPLVGVGKAHEETSCREAARERGEGVA